MAGIYIITFFTDNGAPKLGLSPTMRIRDMVTGNLIVTDSPMQEKGDGFYAYWFEAYSPDGDYGFRADGGAVLSDYDRYQYSSNDTGVISAQIEALNNESADAIASAVWNKNRADHVSDGTFGKGFTFLYDMTGGRWEIVNNQMVFYKEDNTTVVARFNLYNISGQPATEGDIFKRERV